MDKEEVDDHKPSVKELIKLLGERKRPIIVPKKVLTKQKVSDNIPQEDNDSSANDSPPNSLHDFSLEENSTSDEDEIADKKEISLYLKNPKITDEIKTLVREEELYCQQLDELTENYINKLSSEKLNTLDTLGRIDIICCYHNNTFLEDLRKSRNVLKIANCFLKHKNIFNNYYDSYFKNQQNIIFVMNENKDVFKLDLSEDQFRERQETLLKVPNERIQSYQAFLETSRKILYNFVDVSSIDRALEIINRLTENFSKKDETIRFNISEIVETERIYVEKLERITQELVPKIQDTLRSKRRHKSVIGNVPSIYVSQLSFYEDLKKCLFAFDPNEIADCFLRNKQNFLLYVKDQQMKNDPLAIDQCKEILKKDNMDFHAPLNRLCKYKILLKELRKSCEKAEIPSTKVIEALNMINDIISDMNATEAINSVTDENISLNEQGKLILRDDFLVEYKFSEDDKPYTYDSMVYLFEKAVVFTEKRTEKHSRNRRDVFLYKSHIISKHLGIVANDQSEKEIYLYFHGRNKKMFHALHARDEVTKTNFRKAIDDVLMQQLLEEKSNSA